MRFAHLSTTHTTESERLRRSQAATMEIRHSLRGDWRETTNRAETLV
jgi:hypothetical protein